MGHSVSGVTASAGESVIGTSTTTCGERTVTMKSDLDLEDFVSSMHHFSKSIIEGLGQEICPVFSIFTEDHQHLIVQAPYRNDEEKYASVHAVSDLARQNRAVLIAFTVEAWVATEPEGGYDPAFSLRPSERPDRSEVVSVLLVDPDGPAWVYFFPITREGDKRTVGEPTRLDSCGTHGGWMIRTLAYNAPNEGEKSYDA